MKKIRIVFVDAALIKNDTILLQKRSKGAFKDDWTLVGEAVEAGESLEEAMRVMVKKQTGLELTEVHMLGIYDDPDRNPEVSSVSVAFLCSVKGTPKDTTMQFFAFNELPENIGDAIRFHKLLQNPFGIASIIPGKKKQAS